MRRMDLHDSGYSAESGSCKEIPASIMTVELL